MKMDEMQKNSERKPAMRWNGRLDVHPSAASLVSVCLLRLYIYRESAYAGHCCGGRQESHQLNSCMIHEGRRRMQCQTNTSAT